MNPPPSVKRIVVAAVALAIAAVFAPASPFAEDGKGGAFTKIPTVKKIEMIKAGSKGPDFTVQDLAGMEFRLADCRGKEAVLLFFWSFFCGPCREEIPMINQMAQDHRGMGLQVVGVNLDGKEMKKAIDKFVASEKISFRIVFDELTGNAFRVADPYGVVGTPALFLIDRSGVVAFSAVGVVPAEQLKAEIGKVLK